MTSVLILQSPDAGVPDLAADFTTAGFTVLGTGECAHLVRETLRAAPDVLVCWAPRPAASLLQDIATVQAQHPLPVLVFTQDASVEAMEAALNAGVHAWVVQGYGAARLRPLVHLAKAREAHSRRNLQQLNDLRERLEERKWVDQAKGILMRTQSMSEDEAFHALRQASMQGNQRVGQLSRQVIDTARMAEAINRAGRQRMLSQRLVKLFALAAARTEAAAAVVLMRESMQRGEDNLATLETSLSAATYGDLVAAARRGWNEFRAALETGADAAALASLDALAEAVLAQSDALVAALQASGFGGQVGVVNVAGRQRMLSQRVAKLALLGASGGAAGVKATATPLVEAAAAFEDGLGRLQAAPLSTPRIREHLARGAKAWDELRAAVDKAGTAAGRLKIAGASEELLEIFDQLTEAYQHSIEVLMGA